MRQPRLALLVIPLLACAGGSRTGPAPAPAPATGPAPAPRTSASPPPAFGAAPSTAVYQYPRRGAGMQRFAFTRRDSVMVTMPTGETQLQVVGRTAYLTLTWIAGDSGTRLTARVDSVLGDADLAVPLAVLDSARGARWTAERLPGGHLAELSSPTRSLIADQIRDQLALIFPLLPADGARPGAAWVDSTSGPARVSAFEATENATVTSSADPLITAGGALPITAVRARTATGEGTQFGQPMKVRATGTDSLTYLLAADGGVLRMTGRRLTDVIVELPGIGQQVPVQETSVLGISPIR